MVSQRVPTRTHKDQVAKATQAPMAPCGERATIWGCLIRAPKTVRGESMGHHSCFWLGGGKQSGGLPVMAMEDMALVVVREATRQIIDYSCQLERPREITLPCNSEHLEIYNQASRDGRNPLQTYVELTANLLAAGAAIPHTVRQAHPYDFSSFRLTQGPYQQAGGVYQADRHSSTGTRETNQTIRPGR